MNSLGTITTYFPLIDSDTKQILETTMANSYDYSDFVALLKEKVINTDCNDSVVYFAIHHAAQLFDLKSIHEIGQKYEHYQILQPNIFFAAAVQGRIDALDKVKEAADVVLLTNSEDWLALEMRFMKFEAEMRTYPRTMYDSSNLDTIMKIINENPKFSFYETTLYDYLGVLALIFRMYFFYPVRKT